MQRRLAALAAAAAGALVSAQTPFSDGIDWEAYLVRHDPVWRWGSNCTSGYTQHNATIGSGSPGADGCTAVPCSSAATCVEEAASQCDACPGCAAFAVSPKWHSGALPQLYGTPVSLTPNPDWTTWAKGGPALPNHTSCSTTNLATAWEDSAFFGNGLTGGLLRNDPVLWNTSLLLEVGRTDVWDRRAPGSRYAVGGVMYDRPRLPVGWARLTATGGGVITGGTTRVHLHNATITGVLNTTAGSVAFALYAHYSSLAIIVAWNATGGGVGLEVAFFPDPGNSTRQNPPPSYVPNPPPECSSSSSSSAGAGAAGPTVCTQTLLAGGNYATALLSTPGAPWGAASGLSVLHIANDWPASTSPQTAAGVVSAVAAAAATAAGWDALLAEHASAWDAYWRVSWLSVPDTAMEGTYAMQVYKYRCASRPDGPPIDLMGPWWQHSGWELYWFDMNVPVTYWAPLASARFDVSRPLSDWILAGAADGTLAANPYPSHGDSLGYGGVASIDLLSPYNVTPGVQLGNFPWIMHNLYMHAAFTGNDTALAGPVFTALRGAINVYRHYAVVWASDGRLHLPPTASPEYPYPHGPTNDTHYDLALYTWGMRTLLELNARFGLNDPLAPAWTAALAQLTPYPTNEHGYMVSDGVGFDVAHRHFSHLFAMYPLRLNAWLPEDGGTPASRALFATSLDRWAGLTCVRNVSGGSNGCPNGFTYVGVASMSASMGDDDGRLQAAVGNVSTFIRSGLMHASTLYSEGHEPCFESPVGIASSIQELLLQSWGGRLRVFPGVPSTWANASFSGFAAEGGLRVSAVRTGGINAWVALTAAPAAPAPGTTALNVTLAVAGGLRRPVGVYPPGAATVVELPSGDLAVGLPLGSTAVLYTLGGVSGGPPFVAAPLPGDPAEFNYWGKH
jgi:alpha-L-fucosidase 2